MVVPHEKMTRSVGGSGILLWYFFSVEEKQLESKEKPCDVRVFSALRANFSTINLDSYRPNQTMRSLSLSASVSFSLYFSLHLSLSHTHTHTLSLTFSLSASTSWLDYFYLFRCICEFLLTAYGFLSLSLTHTLTHSLSHFLSLRLYKLA